VKTTEKAKPVAEHPAVTAPTGDPAAQKPKDHPAQPKDHPAQPKDHPAH
jgi:hypothetical protein